MADGDETFSTAELMKMIIDKDKIITELLRERAPTQTAAPAFQVMPDLSKGIRDFGGEGDSATALDWLEDLNSMSTLHKWPQEVLLETAKSHLVGPAQDWYRSRRSRITSWAEFDTRFRKTFLSQTSTAERFRRMKDRIQQRNESCIAYFHAKVRLCEDAHLEFSDTREQVLIGLRSRHLCTMLMGRTHDDEELKKLLDILRIPEVERSREQRTKVKGYASMNGRLVWETESDGKRQSKFVLPKCMRKAVVVQCHDLMGHFSLDRTVAKINERFWFPRMRNYVRKHISQCFECIYNKIPGGKKEGLLNPIPPGARPFEVVHLDHMGPFVQSKRRNQHLLVAVDNLTKFVRLFATRDTSAKHVLRSLEEFILERGLPKTIITDRGSCFTSTAFETFCTGRAIRHVLNSTRHPQANGQVERVNRTVLPVITTSMQDPDQRDWDEGLKRAECSLNNAVSKTTGKTPFEMLHGYQPDFYGAALQQLDDFDESPWEGPGDLRERARERLLDEQSKSKSAYDRRHFPAKLYEVGEIVFMRRAPEHTGKPTKTQPKYRGPLVVTQILPSDTYRVSDLDKAKERIFATTAHVSQLKGWTSTNRTTHLDDDDATEGEEEPFEIRDCDRSQQRQQPRRSTRKKTRPERLHYYST